MQIGVLAVQGAFIEHIHMLEKLGVSCVELRQRSDLSGIDGLILPGGESTVQGKLLKELDMFGPLQEMIPSCIMSAASAGVATPPAAKLTTGSLPLSCTYCTSS